MKRVVLTRYYGMTAKTPAGSFDVLDVCAISAIFDLLDVDSQLRFTGSCLQMSHMFGQFAANTAAQCGSAKRACRAKSAVLLRNKPRITEPKCVKRMFLDGIPELIALLPEKYDMDAALYGACRGGHFDLVDMLAAKGVECWARGFCGACMSGNMEMVEKVIGLSGGKRDIMRVFGLSHACKGGNIGLVMTMIEQNGTNASEAVLSYACGYGNLTLAKMMIDRGTYAHDDILYEACRGGNAELVGVLITLGANKWNDGLAGACRGGHAGLAEMMIGRGADDWNYGLADACYAGSIELAEMMLKLGATDLDQGLGRACEAGHRKMAEMMVALGAADLNYGLIKACEGGSAKLAKLMMNFGATSLNRGLIAAVEAGSDDLAKMMIDFGATSIREAIHEIYRAYRGMTSIDLLNYLGAKLQADEPVDAE